MVLLMALTRPELAQSSAVPIYRQAADHIAAAITRGDLRPGDKLPAERDLADDWGIAIGTIRSAMAVLRERGLIISTLGKGTFVTGPPAAE
jgi:DNA-binding GntR family transcriptional regulator